MCIQAPAAPAKLPPVSNRFTARPTPSAFGRVERFVMNWLFRRVLDGDWTQARLTETLTNLSQATRDRFTEDNDPTVDHFLRECLETAISKTSCGPTLPLK